MTKFVSKILMGASLLAISSGAFAQAVPDTADQSPDAGATAVPATRADVATVDNDIVVTGTLLRGTAPVGSPLISLGQEKLLESGASTSNDLLATIPQVTNFFNNTPGAQLGTAVNQLQVARPNLRSLSAPNAASSATLVLVDGHRVAGIGVNQSTIDPELIPIGGLERVEVVTDGGSATYGADAVGGVINFITRKRFDGVKVDARYGFANDYYTIDANATVGKDWGSGSLYAAYNFNKNDALFGRDRDWIKGVDYGNGTLKGRQCAAPNVTLPGLFLPQFNFTLPGSTYAYPSSVPGSFNQCDPSDDKSFVPAAERHSGLVSLYQELSPNVTANVKAYYTDRKTRGTDALFATATLTSANPYLFVPAGQPRPAQETVDFNFNPLLGADGAPFGTAAQEWGANADFKIALGDNWQSRTLFNYSSSNSTYYLTSYNATALALAGADSNPATAFNPFNLAANNATVIANIRNNAAQGQAKDEVLNAREIIDGSLLTLPGGSVQVAVGYEFIRDNFKQRTLSAGLIGALDAQPYTRYGRTVHAVFGEMQVPIFGDDNARPGLNSLVLSASGRYDHYSDFGSTFNPKFGATYKPVDWVSLRGNWGTSFNAPAALDQLGSQNSRISVFRFAPFVRPGDTFGITDGYTVAFQGSNSDLKPQSADTWSIGADIADPPFVPGLRASVSYYSVKFKDLLSTPSPDNSIFANFPANARANPAGFSAAEVRAFAAADPNSLADINTALQEGRPIYALVDFRVGNYGILKTTGLDFNVNYQHDTGFGSVNAMVAGNYQLTRKSQLSPGAPVRNLLKADLSIQQNALPRLQLQAQLGATVGPVRGQATLNHTSAFDVARITPSRPQDKVKAFNTVDLFFIYTVPSKSSLLENVSLTFNVNNVFNQDPPTYRSTPDNGYTNAFTLGRLFMFGVSKQF